MAFVTGGGGVGHNGTQWHPDDDDDYKKMMIMMAMLTILVILLFTGSGVVDDNRARWRCQLWSCLLGVVAIYGGGGTMTSLIMS